MADAPTGSATMLPGLTRLEDLTAAGHGISWDDSAVFGLSHDFDAAPPSWLLEPTEVRRLIAAKTAEDGVPAQVWIDTAGLAACCAEIASEDSAWDGDEDLVLVTYGLSLSVAIAGRLPCPPVPLVDLAAAPPETSMLVEEALLDLADEGPASTAEAAVLLLAVLDLPDLDRAEWARDGLRAVACRLAETITDRLWTDPDVVAGLVDDARRLLGRLAHSLLEKGGR